MHGLWVVGEEVSNSPELLDMILGIGLESMHHVWELHAVPHKEHWEIVSNQVPITFPAVQNKNLSNQVAWHSGLPEAEL